MSFGPNPDRDAFVDGILGSRRVVTWGCATLFLSFPVLIYLELEVVSGAILLILPLILPVIGYGYWLEWRARLRRHGFWVEVEIFNPMRGMIIMIGGMGAAFPLFFWVLVATTGAPVETLTPIVLPFLFFVPLWMVAILVGNWYRKRWYGDAFLRYVPRARDQVVAGVRQALDTSGVAYGFESTGKAGPIVAPAIVLGEGPRLFFTTAPRRDTRIILKVGGPTEAFLPGPSMRLVHEELFRYDVPAMERLKTHGPILKRFL